ncbi:hypothetical protein BDW22DRAFT_883222 [Trametopsis cervina]|nr:hypothetical protein BDW22DRAFT_883222 [Trametopsis cervina]
MRPIRTSTSRSPCKRQVEQFRAHMCSYGRQRTADKGERRGSEGREGTEEWHSDEAARLSSTASCERMRLLLRRSPRTHAPTLPTICQLPSLHKVLPLSPLSATHRRWSPSPPPVYPRYPRSRTLQLTPLRSPPPPLPMTLVESETMVVR